MGFTSYRTWVAGEIVTAALMNAQIRDNGNYLKGVGQVPTIQSGLTIDNTLGTERLLLPLLTTSECTTVLNAEGEVAFDEQTHQMKEYDGTAIRALISEADVDDTPVNGATTVPVSSNWAYDFINTLTTQADLPYATAAGVWARLAKGTASQYLRINAGATAPEWASLPGFPNLTTEIDASWATAAASPQFSRTGRGVAIISIPGDGTAGHVMNIVIDGTTVHTAEANVAQLWTCTFNVSLVVSSTGANDSSSGTAKGNYGTP